MARSNKKTAPRKKVTKKRPAPELLAGGRASDDRGHVHFVNHFDFENVKRFYMIENAHDDIIRAFHGHLKEGKYVFVPHGKAIVAAVAINHPTKPSKKNKVHRFVLSHIEPKVLYIPGGYANGTRSIEPGTKIIFFSTATLEESKADDYRFPHDYWGMKHWRLK